MTSSFTHLSPNTPLAQFFSRHDDPLSRGFITRLDRSSTLSKKRAFFKALALNVFIATAMCAIAYLIIIQDLLSVATTSLKVSICFTQNFLIAFAILVLLRSTTLPFLLGECRLRLLYGFRSSEIIIRKPPTSSAIFDRGLSEDRRLKRYWRMASRAMDPELLYCNAGAVLSPEYWTIEYAAVFDAMKCISKGEIEEDSFEFAIWRKDGGNWGVCELWRMHEIMTDQQEINMFKTFLSQTGHNELIAIWNDTLTNPPSSAVSEKSPSTRSYQAMVSHFSQAGLDYETLWSRVAEKEYI